jgi:ELWxxDGT repeat protein
MKRFTLLAGLLLPLALMAQTLPKGVTNLTGSSVTVTSEDSRAGIKKNPFVVANGKLFFTAKTDASGDELWVSDGTAAGTKMVKDINAGTGSASPRFLVEMDGKVYFQASNGTNGTELWVSDGTDAGTKLVKDLYSGSNSSEPELLTPLNGKLLFSATSAESAVDVQKWLYLYNPADGSVTLVKSGLQPRNVGDSNDRYIITNKTKGLAYFVGQGKGVNDEVYVTDGTSAGTYMIKDICPEELGSSDIQWVHNFNDKYIVWREKTPKAYADSYGGNSSLYKTNLSAQVWMSDGTAAGTHLLKFIDKNVNATTGEGTDTQFAWPFNYKDNLYFRADDGVHGVELWVSDMSGDTAKTKMYRDINPGSWNSWAEDFVVYKDMMCFNADAGGNSWGSEPSYSDGTFGQLLNIADMQPGNGGSESRMLTVVKINDKDSLLYGRAKQPNIGEELWVARDFTNGATGIDMGAGDSKPFNLTAMSGALYFTTTTASSLFKMEYTPSATVKFKSTVKFDNSNYNVPQPLVIKKENLSYFMDPELEVTTDAGKALLLSTDKVNYTERVYLSSNEIDTVWVKVWALNPDESFQNFKVIAAYNDKNDKVDATSATTVLCQVEPVFRAELQYLVEAGREGVKTIETGETLGASQSVADQAYATDATSGKNWGYEGSYWSKDDGTDKWGCLREVNTAKDTLVYKFEVDNGKYLIHMGFKEFWGGRTTNFIINSEKLDS